MKVNQSIIEFLKQITDVEALALKPDKILVSILVNNMTNEYSLEIQELDFIHDDTNTRRCNLLESIINHDYIIFTCEADLKLDVSQYYIQSVKTSTSTTTTSDGVCTTVNSRTTLITKRDSC